MELKFGEWQPIASASEGKLILWRRGTDPEIGWYPEGNWQNSNKQFPPTHWMPHPTGANPMRDVAKELQQAYSDLVWALSICLFLWPSLLVKALDRSEYFWAVINAAGFAYLGVLLIVTLRKKKRADQSTTTQLERKERV